MSHAPRTPSLRHRVSCKRHKQAIPPRFDRFTARGTGSLKAKPADLRRAGLLRKRWLCRCANKGREQACAHYFVLIQNFCLPEPHFSRNKKIMKLQLALDVGHSSIGWAVLSETSSATHPPDLAGCGVVLFEKDGALAIQRRGYRQQRRHVRATRTRIARLERLIEHIGALPPQEIAARHGPGSGHPAPWQLAASVLATKGAAALSWPELWAVLRWYAHNRGYEPWGETDDAGPDAADDTEKVEAAKAALAHYGTSSMAETVCRWLGIEPTGPLRFSHDPARNLRQQKAAFPRDIVRDEVRRILNAHIGKLPGLDTTFVAALMDDARAIPCPAIKLPLRYRGGLLFGRLQMRYDNRIISRCVHTAAALLAQHLAAGKSDAEARRLAERDSKVPAKKCPEFLNYRWGMLLANLRIATADTDELRPLKVAERESLHVQMQAAGRMTKTELRAAVRTLPGWQRDSFDQLFLHPDSDKALLLDPVAELIAKHPLLCAVWPVLPQSLQNRTRKRWWRTDPRTGLAHSTTLAELRAELPAHGGDVAAFDAALAQAQSSAPKTKPRARSKNTAKAPAADAPPSDPLAEPLHIRKGLRALTGRAPYARPLLAKAFAEVMAGLDPKAKGGCLEETEAVRAYREGRPFDHQTNNHLLRHRLLILGGDERPISDPRHKRGLIEDIVAEFAAGDATRFTRVTIEVNRELRDWASKDRVEIVSELKDRLASHTKAVKWLEDAGLQPTGSLIRKARVALDLGCRCPYTDVLFEAVNLRDGLVDLDHIIPRSQRPSDSLESLAITFPAVNRLKGARTAWQFVQEFGGKTVPDAPHLSIITPQQFKDLVKRLDTKGHDDDVRRKRRRKEFFELERYEEKERDFTPGQLAQTSQLTRLARIAVRRRLPHLADHDFVALPGSVTGAVRKAWNLMGCLATVSPDIVGPDGKIRPKDDIRGLTHLHHALDAVTLGYATALLPNNGAVWQLLSLRKIPADQREFFRNTLPVDIDPEGRWRLRSLLENHPAIDQQIRARLAERRVVQHVPADMGGIKIKQNTRGYTLAPDDKIRLNPGRDEEGNLQKAEIIPRAKAFGLTHGKLAAQKGIRVIAENFGVVVIRDPAGVEPLKFEVVRWHEVFRRLANCYEVHGKANVTLLRQGYRLDVPRGIYIGRWVIRGVTDNAKSGLIVDLTKPDFIPGRVSGSDHCKCNVSLRTLMRDGAAVVRTGLAG